LASPSDNVFLNVPFDAPYGRLLAALVAGLACVGRVPRCVLEIPPSEKRLVRIVELIEQCPVSIHDLSRVRASRVGGFHAPRFNMPFELGIAYALHLSKGHRFFLLEERSHRLQMTLSDMNGYDPQIHRGKQEGVLRAVLNCLGAPGGRVALDDLSKVNRKLSAFIGELKKQGYGSGILEPEAFRLAVGAGTQYAEDQGLIA
jgi:hypothetical protein